MWQQRYLPWFAVPLEDQRQHDDGRNVQHEYDDKQQDFEENFNKLMHRTGQ